MVGFQRSTGGCERSAMRAASWSSDKPVRSTGDGSRACPSLVIASPAKQSSLAPTGLLRHCVARNDASKKPQSSPAAASASGRRSSPRCSPTDGACGACPSCQTTACPTAHRRSSPTLPMRAAARRSSPRSMVPSRCSSTMPRALRGTGSARRARRIRRAHGGQCARPDAADRRAGQGATSRGARRWWSTSSTPSWPRPTPII
jgi:hypothetical protein